MKKNKLTIIFAALSFILGIILFSCNKTDDDNIIDSDYAALASDEAAATSAIDDAMAEVDALGLGTSLKSVIGNECRIRNRVTALGEWPAVYEINFQNGCGGATGRIKTGKLRVTIDGPARFRFWEVGTIRTVEFIGFTVNGRKVEGTKTITYLGLNEQNQPQWKVELKNGKITFKDSTYITREFTHIRTLVSGLDTTLKTVEYDWQITGSGHGTTRTGLVYTDTITQPLVLNHNCKHIKTGEVTITIEGKEPITIVYDNANCSGQMIINQKRHQKRINLD